MSRWPVALYIPNLLGYARILLAVVGLHVCIDDPVAAVTIWICSAALDLFDGALARLLHQTSSFGVFLDISADNILRTCIWMAVASTRPSYRIVAAYIVSIEWFTMVSTQIHAAADSIHWKSARQHDPWLVKVYFASNFRNPIGALGIFGLFGSGIFAYSSQYPVLYENFPWFGQWKYAAYLGRAISMVVEWRLSFSYASHVLQGDNERSILTPGGGQRNNRK